MTWNIISIVVLMVITKIFLRRCSLLCSDWLIKFEQWSNLFSTHVFMRSILRPTSNRPPLKYRHLFKMRQRIRHILPYLKLNFRSQAIPFASKAHPMPHTHDRAANVSINIRIRIMSWQSLLAWDSYVREIYIYI